MDSPIQQAIAVIDAAPSNSKGDYILELAQHADHYRETAPALAALLDSSGARTLAQEYLYWNREALKNQQNFQSCSSKAQVWVFTTAAFTVLSLVAALLLGGGAIPQALSEAVPQLPGEVASPFAFLGFAQGSNILVAMLALLAAVSGAAAGVYLNRIQAGRLLETWKESRAQAEAYRRDYFNYLSQASTGPPNPVPLPLLQLEYFRRYQFDVQYAFYQQRAGYHWGYADQSLKLSSAAMAAVVLLNSLSSAGMLSTFNLKLIATGAFALLAQAFANMVINREEVQQNRRKAELYAKTRTALAQLAANLDGIRQAVLEGSQEVFDSFVKATHDVLSKEHQEWLKSFDDVQSAVSQLVNHLDEWKNKSSLENPPAQAQDTRWLQNPPDGHEPLLENPLGGHADEFSTEPLSDQPRNELLSKQGSRSNSLPRFRPLGNFTPAA